MSRPITRFPSTPIDAAVHLNRVNLVYFANLTDVSARAERNALPPMPNGFSMRVSRTGWFGNLDPGDTLDIVADARAAILTDRAEIVVSSHAFRRSDGVAISVRDTVFSP